MKVFHRHDRTSLNEELNPVKCYPVFAAAVSNARASSPPELFQQALATCQIAENSNRRFYFAPNNSP